MTPPPNTCLATFTGTRIGITVDRRTPPPDQFKNLQHVDAENGRNRKPGTSDEGQFIKLNGTLVSRSFKGRTIVAAHP
jgi:hypothetical protein